MIAITDEYLEGLHRTYGNYVVEFVHTHEISIVIMGNIKSYIESGRHSSLRIVQTYNPLRVRESKHENVAIRLFADKIKVHVGHDTYKAELIFSTATRQCTDARIIQRIELPWTFESLGVDPAIMQKVSAKLPLLTMSESSELPVQQLTYHSTGFKSNIITHPHFTLKYGKDNTISMNANDNPILEYNTKVLHIKTLVHQDGTKVLRLKHADATSEITMDETAAADGTILAYDYKLSHNTKLSLTNTNAAMNMITAAIKPFIPMPLWPEDRQCTLNAKVHKFRTLTSASENTTSATTAHNDYYHIEVVDNTPTLARINIAPGVTCELSQVGGYKPTFYTLTYTSPEITLWLESFHVYIDRIARTVVANYITMNKTPARISEVRNNQTILKYYYNKSIHRLHKPAVKVTTYDDDGDADNAKVVSIVKHYVLNDVVIPQIMTKEVVYGGNEENAVPDSELEALDTSRIVHDYITMDEVLVSDYLAADSENIIFIIQTNARSRYLLTNRKHIAQCDFVYSCHRNPDTSFYYGGAYFKSSKLGDGDYLIPYFTLMYMLFFTSNRVIYLEPSRTGEQLENIITLSTILVPNYVSSLHCQGGRVQDVYDVIIPESVSPADDLELSVFKIISRALDRYGAAFRPEYWPYHLIPASYF